MKITIAIGPFNPVPTVMGGAVERVQQTLAEEYARQGHLVTIVSRQYETFPTQEHRNGVSYLRVPSWDAPTSRFLYRAYDYVYSRRVAQILPSSDITVTNSVFLPLVLPKDRAGHIYVHAARFPKHQMSFYRRASRIQTVSSVVADAIKQQSPSVRDRVIAIPNPLTGPLAVPAEPDRQSRPPHILFVGRLAREKGVGLLIEAFARMATNGLSAYDLHIVGSHEVRHQGDGAAYLAELQSLASPVARRVHFHGPIFDPDILRKIYMNADIFVYPSVAERGETFGLAPLEAMAARCRVIVSALDCFKEYTVPNDNAVIFDHRSDPVDALSKAIHSLTSQTDTERMRTSASRTASDFQVKTIADRYIADFKTLLS